MGVAGAHEQQANAQSLTAGLPSVAAYHDTSAPSPEAQHPVAGFNEAPSVSPPGSSSQRPRPRRKAAQRSVTPFSPTDETDVEKRGGQPSESPSNLPQRLEDVARYQAAMTADGGLSLLGARIRVYWPGDRRWYKGSIEQIENSATYSAHLVIAPDLEHVCVTGLDFPALWNVHNMLFYGMHVNMSLTKQLPDALSFKATGCHGHWDARAQLSLSIVRCGAGTGTRMPLHTCAQAGQALP